MSKHRFSLIFEDDNVTLPIFEPDLYDAFSHSIEQKNDSWVVDTRLFAENSELYFTNRVSEKSEMYENINGIIYFHLTHVLERLIDAYQTYGPDAQISLVVDYKISLNNYVNIIKCALDLEDVKTDLLTYFKCGVIENNKRSKFKLREDISIDIYSEKNLDGENINKLQPINILLKSKPEQRKSKWIKTDILYSGAPNGVTNKIPAGSFVYFNFAKNPILYGISDSLIPSPLDEVNNYQDTYNGNMKIIDSKSIIDNIVFKFTNNMVITHKWNGRNGYINFSSLSLYVRISSGITSAESTIYTVWSTQFNGTSTQSLTIPDTIEWNCPIALNEGQFVTYWWHWNVSPSTTSLSGDYDDIDNYSNIVINNCECEINANISTINSVVKGSRLYDCLSKSSEIISGLHVDAPIILQKYDKIACLNAAGLRNVDNVPFNIKTKDLFEACMMFAIDYKVTENDVKLGTYEQFFSDKLIKSFDVKPDKNLYFSTNKDYRYNSIEYRFKNYEQDKDEKNTLDAVHTEQHRLLPNLKTKDPKQIQVDVIVDYYKIEALRKLGLNPNTEETSLSDDTTLAFLEYIDLDDNHYESYNSKLYISKNVNGIKIVSYNFRWDKLGLGLSSSFEILSGSNIGNYQIVSIEPTVLTLQNIGTQTNVSKIEIVSFQYTLENVSYVSRTNEGFSYISGIISPNNSCNLSMSIGRNLLNWMPFIATCTMRQLGKKISVNFYKSNNKLVTRLDTETENLIDTADINIDDIAHLKRVTDRIFNINIYLQKEGSIEFIDILKQIDLRNDDDSIGGYFEFVTKDLGVIKGYPMKLEYVEKENKLEGSFLEKYIDDYFEIYDVDKHKYSRFEAFGIYITLYNNNGVEIFNSKRFTRVKINNQKYDDLDNFINDLQLFFS